MAAPFLSGQPSLDATRPDPTRHDTTRTNSFCTCRLPAGGGGGPPAKAEWLERRKGWPHKWRRLSFPGSPPLKQIFTLCTQTGVNKVAMALKAAHVMKTGWCEWCQRWCTIPSVFLHVAGTPCTDDSPQGTRAGNEYGVTFLPTFVWVCQRLLLRDRVVCHENVPEFCLRFFRATLGSIYIVISIIIDCFDLGWPKRRERRITLFLLREALMDTVSNFEPFVRSCFRTCELAWFDFFVLTDEDFS